MGPEMLIALVAVFVSGGAVGTAGTLLTQWLLRRFDGPSARDHSAPDDVDTLRAEVSEMSRQVRNLDARLDFTERLLDGALTPSLSAPHPRVTEPEPAELPRRGEPGEPRSALNP
jgi:hypothetical protein